jgi:hypothetical protein
MAVAIIIGAQVSARLLPKVGVRPLLLVGTVLVTVGFAWLTQIHVNSGYWDHVFGPGSIVSLAIGVLFTPLASAATSGVHFTEAGLASGVLNTARQMGGSIGLAALATVAIDHTHALLGAVHGSVAAPVALTSGYARAFTVAAAFGVAAFAASFIVPSMRAKTAPSEGEETSEAVVDGEEGALPVLNSGSAPATWRPEPA